MKSLFSKMENKKANQVLAGVGSGGRRKNLRKGCRRMNVVKILCAHV
jgi:hypothetical protein